MNDLRAADDDTQTAGRNGEQLGEGSENHHIPVLQSMLNKRIGIKIMIRLVDDDNRSHLFCPVDHLL